MSVIRLGIIGTGNIGREHIKGFRDTEGAEVAAVTDAHLPGAERAAREFGIPQVHVNAGELIKDESLDAVVIGVPNKYHAELAVAAMDHGKHVLLEKPMAVSLADAQRIVHAQRRTGKIVMISHQLRWHWTVMAVKAQAERGAFGRIYHAKVAWLRRKGIPGWGTWFTRKEESGGGPLIDIGVHMLDLALHLMGDVKPVSVFGATYAEFGPRKKGIGTWGTPNWDGYFDVEDLATAFVRMEDGSTLTLDVSWAAHTDAEQSHAIHLFGSEGGASIRGNKVKFLTEQFDLPMEAELSAPSHDEGARLRMNRHFLACIREGKQPLTHVMTGYTNNLILDAIYRSSETGKPIELDWSL
jgi:predicted dehydrogenase